MSTPYSCADELRAEAVRDADTVNGIDYLEVIGGQTKLEVHFLHPLPGQVDGVPAGGTRLNRTHLVISGGDRVRDIRVVTTSTSNDVLTVTVSGPGDFSTYQLQLIDPVTGTTPGGFDPRLSAIDFSFKAGCPTRFDCAARSGAPAAVDTSRVRDYLAKDYDSFRQLMLDRLAGTVPDWTERNPADLQVTLVELLAFVADRLSYEQDAVAMEAYLGTARRRVSVRRHARLLGYRVHEGCAARAFVHVAVSELTPIEAGRPFLTADSEFGFEALHGLQADPGNNRLDFYTWTDDQCVLPAGSISATLTSGGTLGPGDFLLLEEIAGPRSGLPVDADRAHRHVVRLTTVTPMIDPLDGTAVVEVTWDGEDALPFPLQVSSIVDTRDGPRQRVVCAVARGNVVLVEHGVRMAPVVLSDELDAAGRWLPVLPGGRPTYAAAYDVSAPATRQLALDPRAATPLVEVNDGDRDYDPVVDLLGSGADAAEFVVEPEDDGSTRLRFGDGVYGRRPDPTARHEVSYRQGHGTVGNVGAESITQLRPGDERVLTVRNPMAAAGGFDPEPTEKVRTDAPYAFRIQDRAVTEADYGTLTTERFPGVQRAAGHLRWTGSWYTAFVTVDRVGGGEVDVPFEQDVKGFLDRYRMAGVDVEVSAPKPVPLDLELLVGARPTRFNTDVEADVLDVLSSGVLRDGRRGLFHPDNFTFGTPVYLSPIYAAVLAVPGVATVRATRFQRYGEPAGDELTKGVLTVRDLEIAQLANDPDRPERGLLTVTVVGGR
ncbi:baseplate J/gp47 family protein [Kribbella sp. NBC_00709]|uniref:baseplate J/gp47 family protein n=1 Tax=Kribbella sp. NBC_00709 TaxID=2975972 RepID=UPI002E280EC3|nr:baseplate J/gp47 family protein [Kribbella sp. NBC_00709]